MADPGRAAPAARAPVLGRPLDASMDLLNQIMRQPYDPDYAVVAARGAAPSRFRLGLALVALVIGSLFAVAALQTNRAAPAAERERAELITRVKAAQTRQDTLRAQATDLTDQIADLRAGALGTDARAQATRDRLDELSLATSGTAVTGPGLQIVVDDAPGAEVTSTAVVTAQDVQVLVNGLWAAGAEAVAVNGHRLSTLTAIRQAGSALTVDYASITHPYRIEAIGDPRRFPALYAQTPAEDWWRTLADHQQMRYDVATADDLQLAADPGLTLRHARRADR